MKDNALSIANYFIDIALKDGNTKIKPLKLMKLVYIAHGYMLAMLGHSAIDPRFDKVEAWKFGPVIPSVYHSFKNYGNKSITKKTIVVEIKDNCKTSFEEPKLKSNDAKRICDFVWKKYGKYTDSELVSILHKKGTPWEVVYVKEQNNQIPDSYTMAYYKKLVASLLELAKNE